MKNFRFFAELPEARSSKSASKRWGAFTQNWLNWYSNENGHNNCIAIPLENGKPLWQRPTMGQGTPVKFTMDAFSAIAHSSNAPVELCSVDKDFLCKRGVRISEKLARKLHPALFLYLDKEYS